MYEVDTKDLNPAFVAAIEKMGKSLDSYAAAQDRAMAATTGEFSRYMKRCGAGDGRAQK